ncbi:hypothetical protein [Sphingobacterium chungjuense]|uniref:hypothetical protein n=1 Tax=Sphingobacterium chungjuense TaxID=2675553 RepID=UPI00140CEC24|nr:hypothetical protein [Sphingobacterium chungjuense]
MIQITKQPYTYAPSQNPMVFEFTTDNANTLYFDLIIKRSGSNEILSKLKLFIAPNARTSYTDISKIIDNITSTPIDNRSQFLSNLNGTVTYIVEVTGISATGTTTDNKVTSGTFHAFNGRLNNFDLFNNKMNSYFIQSGYQHSFLSDKPTASYLHYVANEHLYFLADNTSGIANIRTVLSYKDGTSRTINTAFTNPSNHKLHRLNLSPRTLSSQLNFQVRNLKNLKVSLHNSAGTAISEIRQYNIVNYQCGISICNVNWINEFGGMSSNTFQAPKERKQIEKTTYNTNGYLERTNGVYSPIQKVISNRITNTYNITSQSLTDQEFTYMSSIINSRDVYCELAGSGELYPIVLDTSSVDVLKRKYTKQHNRMILDFSSNANLSLEMMQIPEVVVKAGFDYDLDIIF